MGTAAVVVVVLVAEVVAVVLAVGVLADSPLGPEVGHCSQGVHLHNQQEVSFLVHNLGLGLQMDEASDYNPAALGQAVVDFERAGAVVAAAEEQNSEVHCILQEGHTAAVSQWDSVQDIVEVHLAQVPDTVVIVGL